MAMSWIVTNHTLQTDVGARSWVWGQIARQMNMDRERERETETDRLPWRDRMRWTHTH